MNNHSQKLIIYDDAEYNSKLNSEDILLWNGYNHAEKSILYQIDNESENLKKEIITELDFFHTEQQKELKKININIEKKINFWSINSMIDNNNIYDQVSINDYIKFYQLKKIIKKKNINHITFYSNNNELIKKISFFCEYNNLKIKFKKIKTKIVLNNKFIKKIVHPIFLAFPIFLIFLFKRAKFFLNPFIRKKKMNQNLFVNYFVGSSLLKKNLHSVYWGNLDEVLDTNKIKRTWLHLSVPEGNPNNSEELLNKLNTNPLSEHVVLDSYFNVKIFLKIILVWFKIILKINKIEKKLKGNSKDKFFYVLFRNDFKENIFGYKFLINLYYFYLFKLFFNQNREYKNCFYLYENQSWERSLIYNLNANKMKTNKFGIIHSSVRFWDLRYAKMNNLYNNSELLNFSHDKIFVSSEIFKKILLDNNINDNQIILGETLRYKYISNFDENIFINKNNDYLVVLGDYSVNINKKIEVCINLLSKNNRCKIICKPHPLNDFKEIYKHNSNIYKSLETVQELSEKYNNFVVPSTSTVGLELYLMGKNVITVLDDELINYSPLKHYYEYQNYVYDINLIQKKVANGIKNFSQINFFEQSKNLETWIKIIKNV